MTYSCNGAESLEAKSPLAFGVKYLPHYLSAKSPPFHRQLCALWQRRVMKNRNPALEEDREYILKAKGKKAVIAAPRGHGKSTLMCLQNVLHAALYGYKKYIIIVSDTEYQAAGFLDAIKAELEENAQIIADFGELKGKVWKSSSILLSTGVRIDALGCGQKVRGRKHGARRPDLIILDDIESDEDIHSFEGRRRLASWYFGALSKAGDIYTDIIFIGTLLHHDCLLANLLQNPAYQAKCYKAIEQFSPSPLWDEWRAIYTNLADEQREKHAERFFGKNRREMLKGTRVLWPKKMPYYDLCCMLVSEGEAAFYREMQNQPTDPQSLLFPLKWIKFYNPFETDFTQSRFSFFGYCDPSLGKSLTSDYSAIITIAKDNESGLLYIEEADIARRHPDVIIDDIIKKARSLYGKYGRGFTLFGAESNQFQWFLKEQLAKESARTGVYLPLKEVYQSGDKAMRIQTLQPDIINGYLLFDENHGELLSQLTQFPFGRHDDGPDALEGAVKLCKSGGRLSTISGLRI